MFPGHFQILMAISERTAVALKLCQGVDHPRQSLSHRSAGQSLDNTARQPKRCFVGRVEELRQVLKSHEKKRIKTKICLRLYSVGSRIAIPFPF